MFCQFQIQTERQLKLRILVPHQQLFEIKLLAARHRVKDSRLL